MSRTGNPQITFWKVVYRRHTNFAMEAIEQSFNGNSSLCSRVSVLVTRNGDLINRIYFKGTLKNSAPLLASNSSEEEKRFINFFFANRIIKIINSFTHIFFHTFNIL